MTTLDMKTTLLLKTTLFLLSMPFMPFTPLTAAKVDIFCISSSQEAATSERIPGVFCIILMGGFWRTSPQTHDFAWGWGSWEVQIPFSIQGPTVKLLIQYRKDRQLHYRLKHKHPQGQHCLKSSHILQSLSKVSRQNCENLGEKSHTFS